MNVVLIGYRGSGKSSVARELADRLGRPMADADELVVARAGRSIKEIFAERGEPRFRELEAAALAELSLRADHVIALGGGVVERADNRATLEAMKARGDLVVYLRCNAAELARRIETDPSSAANRPHLTALGGSLAEVRAVLQRREPWYRQVMTVELDVSALSVEQTAARLIERVRNSQA